MCRHIAFLGQPTTLAELLLLPEYGLLRQSWGPRRQRFGTVNADGFGVGWYAPGDPVPARYRRAVPMWTDASFADVARVTQSTAVLAAVRSATAGTSQDESAAAPYADGRWLFSHNGRIDGWPGQLETLAAKLPPSRLLSLEAQVDSAFLWALVLDRLAAGDAPDVALARTVADVLAASTGRLNLMLTDGVVIIATALGDTLFWRTGADGTTVASEPSTDHADWHEVPDNSLIIATRSSTEVRPLTHYRKETAAS